MAPVEEDEIGQWLQYPLDDDADSGSDMLDKGFYCSDFFGSSTWLPPPPPSPSPSPTPFVLPAGQMGGALSDRLAEAAPAVMSSAVNAALAMGAERASGVVVPSGLEAFSKVRTSLQQGQGKPLGLCYKGGKKLAEVAAPPAFGPYSTSASSCYHSSLTAVPVARAATPKPPPANRPLMATPRTDISTAEMLTSRSKMATAETTTPRTEIGTFRDEKGTSRAENGAFRAEKGTSRAETSTPRTEMGTFRAEMGTLRTEMGTTEMDTSGTEMGAADMDSSRIEMETPRTEMDTPRTERAAAKVSIARTEIGTSISKALRTSPTSGPDTASIRPLTCTERSLKEVDGQIEDVEGELMSFKHHHRHHRHHPLPRTSLKRSRSTEIHNLSERRRRDRINEKMRALQELIPNSNKTDKASVLDEAIDYLKMLQAQVQMMTMRSGMFVPPMMFNPAMQAPPPMAPLNPLHHHPGMSMVGPGTGMGLGIIARPDFPPPPPPPPPLSSSSSSSSSSSYTSSSSSSPSPSSSCCLAQTSNSTPGLSSCGTVPSSADSFVASGTPYYAPLAFPYSQYQVSPQAFQPINMDAYNTFLLHQQYLQHHQQQHYHHHHHHQPEQPQQQQQQPQNGSPPNG